MKQPRKHYDKAFKIMAVDLYRSGKTFLDVSKDLGLEVGMIQRWNREYGSFLDASFPGNGKKILSEEQREILSLKKHLKDVEMERDILKKAVSIFSKSDSKSIGL